MFFYDGWFLTIPRTFAAIISRYQKAIALHSMKMKETDPLDAVLNGGQDEDDLVQQDLKTAYASSIETRLLPVTTLGSSHTTQLVCPTPQFKARSGGEFPETLCVGGRVYLRSRPCGSSAMCALWLGRYR